MSVDLSREAHDKTFESEFTVNIDDCKGEPVYSPVFGYKGGSGWMTGE